MCVLPGQHHIRCSLAAVLSLFKYRFNKLFIVIVNIEFKTKVVS